MLIEAARRARDAAREMVALGSDDSVSCAELREALEISRAFMAAGSAFQAAAAAAISGRERHGDGGAQVLADSAGLTRHDAHSQIKTADVLQSAPVVRDAVESGRVSQANARRLAEAISKTDPRMVESDGGLLERAASMRPEQFRRVARRWTADRQRDGGEGDYRRMRAKRSVRIFDGDDGMVHLHGELDPVTGRRVANRLNREARRLHSADQRAPGGGSADGGGRSANGGERRSLPQCLADALDNLTNAGSAAEGAAGNAGKPYADICLVAHVDDETGSLIGELPDGSRLPSSVLDELTCNATITGVVFDRKGKAIWRTTAGRDATETQRRILKAEWGGCFHCGANFAICQPHHIEPVSQGGQTRIENLVPACWGCHNLIHRHGWQIHKSPDGNHTLHPPKRVNFGPAHAPEHPPAIIANPPLFAAPPAAPDLPLSLFGVAPDLPPPAKRTTGAAHAVAGMTAHAGESGLAGPVRPPHGPRSKPPENPKPPATGPALGVGCGVVGCGVGGGAAWLPLSVSVAAAAEDPGWPRRGLRAGPFSSPEADLDAVAWRPSE